MFDKENTKMKAFNEFLGMSFYDKLAEMKKYHLGIQNIQISNDVQEYIKKRIILPKDKQ